MNKTRKQISLSPFWLCDKNVLVSVHQQFSLHGPLRRPPPFNHLRGQDMVLSSPSPLVLPHTLSSLFAHSLNSPLPSPKLPTLLPAESFLTQAWKLNPFSQAEVNRHSFLLICHAFLNKICSTHCPCPQIGVNIPNLIVTHIC